MKGFTREELADRDGVNVAIIQCATCGRLGVAIADTRITGHKCAGRWNYMHEELVARGLIRGALTKDAEAIARSAGEGKDG